MQDIEVGYPEIDAPFILKANEVSKARALFGSVKIRQLIQSLVLAGGIPVLEAERRQAYMKTLYYTETGIITDIVRLKLILELVTEVLNQLRKIGSAFSEEENKYMKEKKEKAERFKKEFLRRQISAANLPAKVRKRLFKDLE